QTIVYNPASWQSSCQNQTNKEREAAMASKVTVDPGKLTRFSAKILQNVGVPEADAERTAGMLVAADLRGIDSHGVSHLGPLYVKRIKEGIINPKPQITPTALSEK
ncbi:MAG: Ldh family oxidoreductase, partial [Neisseriaceae bacterium]|nr:Ldh family oxidoreductase [Neisseriaceae bacterium]